MGHVPKRRTRLLSSKWNAIDSARVIAGASYARAHRLPPAAVACECWLQALLAMLAQARAPSSRPIRRSSQQRLRSDPPPVAAAHGPRKLPPFSAQIVGGFGRVEMQPVEQGAGKQLVGDYAGWLRSGACADRRRSIDPRAEANWRHSLLMTTAMMRLP